MRKRQISKKAPPFYFFKIFTYFTLICSIIQKLKSKIRRKIMPLIKLQTSIEIDEEHKKTLLAEMSQIVAKTLGKPEQYMMAVLEKASIILSAKADAAAFIEVKSIGGLNGNTNKELSKKLCSLLEKSLNISPDRVYINFIDIPATNWGFNGNTFG